MKKLLLMLFALPLICCADFDLEKWQYYKEIKIEQAGLNSFTIDSEIFQSAENHLRDLRVIAGNNQEIPYKLLKSASKAEERIFSPKMLNKSALAGENSSVVLDFGENNQGVNYLEIITDSENFQTNARVLGADTIGDWRVIAEDIYIYDYSDRKGKMFSKRTALNFPETIYRYLKIEIADQSGVPIRINNVVGKFIKQENAKEFSDEVSFQKIAQAKNTEITIDTEREGVPHGKIALVIADENFSRSLSIRASFNGADWRNVGSAYIYRYHTEKYRGENLLVEFPEAGERFIKLIIHNNDDAPLNVDKILIFSIFRQVLFTAQSNNEYRVYYGNKNANTPVYDLEKYFQYLDLSAVKVVGLSEEKANPAFKVFTPALPDPKSEKIKGLMSISLTAAAIILLILTMRFFRKKD